MVTFDDLLDITNTPQRGRKFRVHNRNVQQIKPWIHWLDNLCTARFFCHFCNKKRHSVVTIATELGEGEFEGLVSCTFEVAYFCSVSQ